MHREYKFGGGEREKEKIKQRRKEEISFSN